MAKKDIVVVLPLRLKLNNNSGDVWSQTPQPYNGRYTTVRRERETSRFILSESPKKNPRRSREGDPSTTGPYSFYGYGPYRGEWYVSGLKELIELARLGGMSEEELFGIVGKQTIPSFTDVSELFLLKTWGHKWRDLMELLVNNPDMYEALAKRHKKADGQDVE